MDMKRLTCTTPGTLSYETAPKPPASEGTTVLQVKRVGICGTDLHAFEGTQPFFSYPRVLGHEIAAVIEETDRAGFAKGDAVTIIPYLSCGACIACRSGTPNCCVNIRVCGVHIDGAMAEYYSVPSDALMKHDALQLDELALVEPLAIGAHAIRRAAVRPGEFVLVAGAGPIGLGVIELARIAGAQVIVTDVQANRLAFCRQYGLADHVIDAGRQNVLDELRRITSGDMPSVVIDATGNRNAINTAFQYLSHGGRYVLVGLQGGEISFSHPEFHKREATLMSSRNATRGDFEQVMHAMANGRLQTTRFITHRTHFDEVGQTFAQWLDPDRNVIKAMVHFD